jgi:aminotransferase in exopolysaccharide biosynthesis
MSEINQLAQKTIAFAKEIYGEDYIPLHRPVFEGNEKEYLIDCIDSNFVSSVGERVSEFELKIAEFTGSKHAIATVNGTSALHIAINLAGVNRGDEVITQALTFIATCNAIVYAGAKPLFIDVDLDTMGLSPKALRTFLEHNAHKKGNESFNKKTGKKISACVPMHTFGFPCRIEEIAEICEEWGISLIEDSAESLGSYIGKHHTGTFASMAALSFNGNKLITTGGGGMIITDNSELAKMAKHVTTTAKIPHAYEFYHDQVGYNYRMPNLNAALGCAQMEKLDKFLSIKKKISQKWNKFFKNQNILFCKGIGNTTANNWLNAIVLNSKKDREEFLKITNKNNVMTRPIWKLMSELTMFKECQNDGLKNSIWLQDRVINIPSSIPNGAISPK